MRMLKAIIVIFLLIPVLTFGQRNNREAAKRWTDSVFNSLSEDERIAQLMVIRAHSNLGPDHVAKVADQISKYNVGALCFFQGGPVRQANLTNYYQGIAKTPLMVTIDGEWGLGMRLDSVKDFPYQLTLGALEDPNLVYRMGRAVGEQCKRIGVHVNYAPVVDINNNPNNPVIGYRAFGEDKNKVSEFGIAYMKGMQDVGIMACAKHFPGHGDVDVDSHYDLPVINKSRAQLDSMELQPFRAIFNAGVGSAMIAHLYIPSIDDTPNKATSLSRNNVTKLLREEMGYDGLTFTDALEMKGVSKFFPGGTIAAEALVAGNDMLCLPESIPESISSIRKAIEENRLSWDDINTKVRRVLEAKYELGLSRMKPIDTNNLLEDINAKTDTIRYEVAKEGITVLPTGKKGSADAVGIPLLNKKKVAYVAIGTGKPGVFAQRMEADLGAQSFFYSGRDGKERADEIVSQVAGKFDAIIIGIHNYSLRPMKNFGLSDTAIGLYRRLNSDKAITMTFGNVQATANFCDAYNLVACYQDDEITQQAAADLVTGKIVSRGRLPVRVCKFQVGDGVVHSALKPANAAAEKLGRIDSIVQDAISQKAFPGAVVLAAYKGEIIYHKAFGNYEYGDSPSMTPESIFDLASVTKISATTVSIMKLYDEGKIRLDGKLGDYLPWVRGTDKEHLMIRDILLHQAGLVPFIPFYKETIDSSGAPRPDIYSESQKPGFTVRVAENIYLRDDWNDTMFSRILASPLGRSGRYVYSDNHFIFLGKIVEQLSGLTLDQYAAKTFYRPMGMWSTGFKPRTRFEVDKIVPTEEEKHFRRQLTRGDVHDEGASMFGGVAGHAGLFSNSYDLAMLYQMLLNGGTFNGERYLKPETIKLFTSYGSGISRRGLGFDKPEKDNKIRPEPYPSLLASPQTFGHTGFTGTCVWVDPKHDLVYIFLSNRVYPTRNNPRLSSLGVRGKIQDAIYEALGVEI